jgi:hypothetical protein
LMHSASPAVIEGRRLACLSNAHLWHGCTHSPNKHAARQRGSYLRGAPAHHRRKWGSLIVVDGAM